MFIKWHNQSIWLLYILYQTSIRWTKMTLCLLNVCKGKNICYLWFTTYIQESKYQQYLTTKKSYFGTLYHIQKRKLFSITFTNIQIFWSNNNALYKFIILILKVYYTEILDLVALSINHWLFPTILVRLWKFKRTSIKLIHSIIRRNCMINISISKYNPIIWLTFCVTCI